MKDKTEFGDEHVKELHELALKMYGELVKPLFDKYPTADAMAMATYLVQLMMVAVIGAGEKRGVETNLDNFFAIMRKFVTEETKKYKEVRDAIAVAKSKLNAAENSIMSARRDQEIPRW